jgi:hypothetical protein
MAPVEIRERRRTLRYRNLLVRQAVQMKNKMAGLLMESGVTYNQEKLHQKKYFSQLVKESEELPEALKPARVDAGQRSQVYGFAGLWTKRSKRGLSAALRGLL